MGDRITVLVVAGAISATLGVGSCSTKARIDDVNALAFGERAAGQQARWTPREIPGGMEFRLQNDAGSPDHPRMSARWRGHGVSVPGGSVSQVRVNRAGYGTRDSRPATEHRRLAARQPVLVVVRGPERQGTRFRLPDAPSRRQTLGPRVAECDHLVRGVRECRGRDSVLQPRRRRTWRTCPPAAAGGRRTADTGYLRKCREASVAK